MTGQDVIDAFLKLHASALYANVVIRTGEDADLAITDIKYDHGEVIIEVYETQRIYE